MNKVRFYTTRRIKVPKLFSCDMFGTIVKETEKAYLVTNFVQEHAHLYLKDRWIAKSIVESITDEVHIFEYTYESLYGGIMQGMSTLTEVEK